LPIFGAKRGPGCEGRWLLVGPLAWLCSDNAEYSPSPPSSPPPRAADDGLPYRYYFVGHDGAYGYANLSHADEDAPDAELQPGFAVAVVDEKVAHDDRWLRTRSGYWLRARDLGAARPSPFHGELLPDAPPNAPLDVAWVTADRTVAFAEPKPGKPVATLERLERVHYREEKTAGGATWVRTSEDGAAPRWMRAKDLAHPTPAPVPTEPGFDATKERWIDVDLATQTLTAYEGARPVFATLVSSGRGAPGTDSATPPGAHRIWVKLLSTNMDNLENDDAEQHYSIEDVPYVQFFDNAVALHGAFWHRAFGRTFSHGCVNLAPKDARWLFGFTSPHLPAGWSAAMPMQFEKGALVRVR
jgi:lipoprotein-anchoring transpeptidase ErfK/SrfK